MSTPSEPSLRILPVLAAAAVIVGATLQAHHSIANVYDFSERLTLRVVVVAFEFVNPHPFITADVGDPAGQTERWRFEMDNRRELAELGFARETLAPGDRLTLIVNPARNEPHRGYVRQLERAADGFKYRHHD